MVTRRARLPAAICPDCGRPVILTLWSDAVRCSACGACDELADALAQLESARAVLSGADASGLRLGEEGRRELRRPRRRATLALLVWLAGLPALVAAAGAVGARVPAGDAAGHLVVWLGPVAAWLLGGAAIARRLVAWPRWVRQVFRASLPQPGASAESCRVCGATLGAAAGAGLRVVACGRCGADNLALDPPLPVASYEGRLTLGGLEDHVREQAAGLGAARPWPAWLVVAAALAGPWAGLCFLAAAAP
jgi:DNA-directed RNA polymerase subunit RPC12/RpoP